jgi:hypothetical protein
VGLIAFVTRVNCTLLVGGLHTLCGVFGVMAADGTGVTEITIVSEETTAGLAQIALDVKTQYT